MISNRSSAAVGEELAYPKPSMMSSETEASYSIKLVSCVLGNGFGQCPD